MANEKNGQHHVLGDFPALDVLDGVADDFPDRSDIQAGIVLRQCTFEGAQAQVEILAQHLDQGRIEAGLVVTQAESVKPERALLRCRLTGTRINGSAVALAVAVFACPG